VLRQSLDLIMLGERVFPSALLLKHLGQGDHRVKQGDTSRTPLSFSARDDEILCCLAKGYSNKMIAKSVGITEAATKAHLKAILQRIGAANRTQAAIWAINRGLRGKVSTDAPSPLNFPDSAAAAQHAPSIERNE